MIADGGFSMLKADEPSVLGEKRHAYGALKLTANFKRSLEWAESYPAAPDEMRDLDESC